MNCSVPQPFEAFRMGFVMIGRRNEPEAVLF